MPLQMLPRSEEQTQGGKGRTGAVGAGPGLWAYQRGLAGQWPLSCVKPLLSSRKAHSFLPAGSLPRLPTLDLAMLNLRAGEQFPEQGKKNKGPEGCLGERKWGGVKLGLTLVCVGV